MNNRWRYWACAAAMAAISTCTAGADDESVRPDIPYVDSAESFAGPARGYAPGGWKVFLPEGLPKWHGAKSFNSSLWELSRFSGGRLQGKHRPPEKRVGKADIPLTDAMKSDVRRYLSETRLNGGSLIVRLGYTWSDSVGCEPSDFKVLLGHVRDLSAIMSDFDDVIVGVEAGVAGPWGEMHSSDYCRPEYMNRILKTYCETLPQDISILVRTPHYIASFAATNAAGIAAMLPFKAKDLQRFGMYNDGYLGTWWDYGTWSGPWKRELGRTLLSTFGDHPYGGELAYVGMDWILKNRERTRELFDPARWNIVEEWYRTHLNYLRNAGDTKHPLCKFIAGLTFNAATYKFDGMPDLKEYEGADLHKFMFDHMGYRFVVRDARIPKALRRNDNASIVLDVENTGFGRLLLPSRIDVVLTSGAESHVVPARGDVSSIPGGEKRRVEIHFHTPCDINPGRYNAFLRVCAPLKDEKPGDMPRRPVRFANAGMWNDELKANGIGALVVLGHAKAH